MADPSKQELVVVAIPKDDDYVRKISSESVPHMTLLYLGSPDWTSEQFVNVVGFVQHAASVLGEFGMSVDRRGKLGPNDADVLFFEKSYNYKMMEQFRTDLLTNQDISKAYLTAPQYPSWTPHLTLGFPETPANPDPRDYGFTWVGFDKIALWTGDSDGPTFQLKSQFGLEVAMSQAEMGAAAVEELLHYGVKGMKWGQHKKSSVPAGETLVTQRKPGQRVKAVGGKSVPAHEDAINKAKNRQIAKKSTTDALSTKELQALVNRLNLEKQYHSLNPGRAKQGQTFIKGLIGLGKTANEVVAFNNSPAGKQLREKFNS